MQNLFSVCSSVCAVEFDYQVLTRRHNYPYKRLDRRDCVSLRIKFMCVLSCMEISYLIISFVVGSIIVQHETKCLFNAMC